MSADVREHHVPQCLPARCAHHPRRLELRRRDGLDAGQPVVGDADVDRPERGEDQEPADQQECGRDEPQGPADTEARDVARGSSGAGRSTSRRRFGGHGRCGGGSHQLLETLSLPPAAASTAFSYAEAAASVLLPPTTSAVACCSAAEIFGYSALPGRNCVIGSTFSAT